MTFNDFVHKYKLNNEATSNTKIYQILCSIGLNNVGIYLRDRPFESDIGILNLHPSKGTHWVCYINEECCDSYGSSPLNKLSEFITKRNGHCLYSEYKIQGLTSKQNSFCASFSLNKTYLTKVIGIDFEYSVLNLHYQMIQ